jgi:hypothetical protein
MAHAPAALSQVRHTQFGQQSVVHEARQNLAVALDAYVSRLTADGMPVPHRLRNELRMHSALLETRRR